MLQKDSIQLEYVLLATTSSTKELHGPQNCRLVALMFGK